MQKFLVLFLFLISFSTFSYKNIVGYGSSNAVLPLKNQELFYLGFELGFSKNAPPEFRNSVVTSNDASGSPLGAVQAVNSLIARNVKLLVGFPTSHEALLGGKIAAAQNILFIANGASHSDIAKLGPSIFSTGESISYDAKELLNFANKKFKGHHGFVITNPNAVFSVNLELALKQKNIQLNTKKLDLTFLTLTPELELSLQDIKKIKGTQKAFFIITHYADESNALLKQFSDQHLDLPVIANSSWTTGDVEMIRRHITQRKQPLYSMLLWQKGSADSREFEKLLMKKYGREPIAEISFGYDLGIITGELLSRVKEEPTSLKILNAFLNNPCFANTSSGTICFPVGGGHATRKIYFVKFHKRKAFIPIEENL